ncbi:hypothetical protein [Planomicrobium okeanokoites]|uniref:hypothetical protein n=1 Tax=Planomicrobium okeanokoites TaxID=244 RepID=UPI00249222A5|nr:hypothetical protein [Planomicrobium okeanokoites]
MKKINLKFLSLFISSIILGVMLSNFVSSAQPIVHQGTIYEEKNLKELVQQADTVIYGEVWKKGEAEKLQITLDDGEVVEDVRTEIEIKVKENIKGSSEGKIVKFIQYGGEVDGIIYESDGGVLEKGDEIIIFLNEYGFNWGEQSLLKLNKDEVRAKGEKYKLKELVKELNTYLE